jgi:hypothetical protein
MHAKKSSSGNSRTAATGLSVITEDSEAMKAERKEQKNKDGAVERRGEGDTYILAFNLAK